MKVTAVEANTCVVPLDTSLAIATRALRERHYTLVRVRTETGAEGLGFCYGGHKAGRLVTIAVCELLRDVVVGRDAHQVEAIWEAMYREALLHGRRGSVLRAMSYFSRSRGAPEVGRGRGPDLCSRPCPTSRDPGSGK